MAHKLLFVFTSSTNIAALQHRDTIPSTSQGQLSRQAFNFQELCIFCCKKSQNKDRFLFRVSTDDFCNTLQSRSGEERDAEISRRIGGDFSKLIPLEARYHKACHSRYIIQNKTSTSHIESAYNVAFGELLVDIKQELVNGTALNMASLLDRYKVFLRKYIPVQEAEKYRRQSLKDKIKTQCSKSLQIHQGSGNRPDIVTSSTVKLEDVINTVAHMKEIIRQVQYTENSTIKYADLFASPTGILYHAALILRSSLRSCQGIQLLWILELYARRLPRKSFPVIFIVFCTG